MTFRRYSGVIKEKRTTWDLCDDVLRSTAKCTSKLRMWWPRSFKRIIFQDRFEVLKYALISAAYVLASGIAISRLRLPFLVHARRRHRSVVFIQSVEVSPCNQNRSHNLIKNTTTTIDI